MRMPDCFSRATASGGGVSIMSTEFDSSAAVRLESSGAQISTSLSVLGARLGFQ